MRVVLVYPDLLQVPNWPGYFYEGLASLGAVLKEAGHEPLLVHVISEDQGPVLDLVRQAAGDESALVAFSCTTNQKVHLETWTREIRRELDLPMIVGGVHVTLNPEQTLQDLTDVDWACCGDGEEVVVRVAQALARGEQPGLGAGLWGRSRETGAIIDGGVAVPVDLDDLPFPLRDLFSLTTIQGGELGLISAMGSRGCPYSCTYCCNKALREVYGTSGRYLRQKSPEKFVAEIEEARRVFPKPLEGIFFEDDVFGLNRQWLEVFASLYQARIGLPFGCNLRPEMAKPEVVKLLRQAGCRRVHIGLESGDEKLRRGVLGRELSNRDMEVAVARLQEAGIEILTYNLLGLPGETPEAILETIKFNARLAPNHIQSSIFYPFFRTELFALVEREKLFAQRVVDDYFADTALDLPDLSRDQILFFQALFQPLIKWYQRLGRWPRPLGSGMELVTDWFCKSALGPAITRFFGAWRRPK